MKGLDNETYVVLLLLSNTRAVLIIAGRWDIILIQ